MIGRALSLCAVIFIVASLQGMAEDKVALKIILPTAIITGTPVEYKTTNLEPERKKPRRPIRVPKGVTNVAFGKAVSGSDIEPIVGELEYVTDGAKDAVGETIVECASGKQYVQIDLEKTYKIYAIVIWHFHSQKRVYKNVVVQLASDPDFVMNVETVFNADYDGSLGLGVGKDKDYVETYEGKLIKIKGKKGQYVRLYSNGNTSNESNHYIEVEVYGKE